MIFGKGGFSHQRTEDFGGSTTRTVVNVRWCCAHCRAENNRLCPAVLCASGQDSALSHRATSHTVTLPAPRWRHRHVVYRHSTALQQFLLHLLLFKAVFPPNVSILIHYLQGAIGRLWSTRYQARTDKPAPQLRVNKTDPYHTFKIISCNVWSTRKGFSSFHLSVFVPKGTCLSSVFITANVGVDWQVFPN